MSRGREYDAAITIFSPEGRIYQVEYALELVKRGAPIVGVYSPEGVVLAAIESKGNRLEESMNSKKIFQIDEHVGATIAGFSPDARVLVRQARLLSQSNRLTYDEPIDIENLTSSIGDLLQRYTQHAGVRPFGVSIIIAGVDSTGGSVLATDPSGSYRGYKAVAVGRNNEKARELLAQQYSEGLSLEEATALAVEAVKGANENPVTVEELKIAVVPVETKTFRRFSAEEAQKYLQ